MRARIVTVSSLLALTLCAAGWVRSYLPEFWTIRAHKGSLFLVFYGAERGQYIDPANNPGGNGAGPQQRWDTETILTDCRAWASDPSIWPNGLPLSVRFAGFELVANTRQQLSDSYFVVAAPFWALCLPPAVVAGWGLFKWRRQRIWRREGRCRGCGYDLRATTGACPECGTPAAPDPASNAVTNDARAA